MTTNAMVLRRLLHEIVDYAGLFPPAQLSMPEAVGNFAAYRTGPRAWMLGRFICPVARLPELAESVSGLRSPPRARWPLSVVAGEDIEADVEGVEQFNRKHAGELRVDAIELRVSDPAKVDGATRRARERLQVFVEFPLSEDPEAFASALQRVGVHAKARTGGTAPEAVPSSTELARFLGACAGAAIAFKATAGLHHPLRSENRLSYESNAPRAMMHGFLNVLLAAALARGGARGAELVEVLEERDATSFRFDPALAWRDRELSADAVHEVRGFMIAFGSCSFTEPVEDLMALQLL